MLNLNQETLKLVVEKAAHDAANSPRWLQAIARAIVELDSNPWIERGELHGLIIASPSGNLYTANGTCQCPAHTYGNACWHRAASRIVRLHDEREAAAAALAAELVDEQGRALVEAAALRITRKIAAQRATAQLNELFA